MSGDPAVVYPIVAFVVSSLIVVGWQVYRLNDRRRPNVTGPIIREIPSHVADHASMREFVDRVTPHALHPEEPGLIAIETANQRWRGIAAFGTTMFVSQTVELPATVEVPAAPPEPKPEPHGRRIVL